MLQSLLEIQKTAKDKAAFSAGKVESAACLDKANYKSGRKGLFLTTLPRDSYVFLRDFLGII